MYIQPYKADHDHRRARAFVKSLISTEDEKITQQKQALIRTKCHQKGFDDLNYIVKNLGIIVDPDNPEYEHYYMHPDSDNPIRIVSISQARVPCIYNPITRLTCTFNFN